MNSRYEMLDVQTRHDEMLRAAEHDRLVQAVRASKPSLWARVRRFTLTPARRPATPTAAPVRVKVAPVKARQ